jgi:nicotinamide-nucleotide amidase
MAGAAVEWRRATMSESGDPLLLLAERAGSLLLQCSLKLALAESCTGGLVGSLITDVPGSSDYFLGGAVTYANSAKAAVLGVRQTTLAEHGAVSPQAAGEMAQGARRLFGADVAVAVTGIAGPTGGLPGKPVGLVYLHLSTPDAEIGERHVWDSDRVGNKRLSAEAVLRLLVNYLEAGGMDAETRGLSGAGGRV